MIEQERRTRVVTYRTERLCQQIGCIGTVTVTGRAFTQLQASFEHLCGTCGKTTWLDAKYPKIEYQDEAEE